METGSARHPALGGVSMKTIRSYFGKDGSGWRWLPETLYVFALVLPVAAAILN